MTDNEFQLLPGHRTLILELGKSLNSPNRNSDNNLIQNTKFIFSNLLTELNKMSIFNLGKTVQARRYSEIIQYFCIYMYMVCGKFCYEILSTNLPIPAPSTVCKYSVLEVYCQKLIEKN